MDGSHSNYLSIVIIIVCLLVVVTFCYGQNIILNSIDNYYIKTLSIIPLKGYDSSGNKYNHNRFMRNCEDEKYERSLAEYAAIQKSRKEMG